MKISTIALAGLLLVSSLCVSAKIPVSGIWWNPAEPGRGWTFEEQNDLIAISHYTYDMERRATFYVSVGPWNEADDSITTTLTDSQNGQCIGCSYSAPQSTSLGTVRFEFDSGSAGTVIYPDGTIIPIQKLNFGFPSDLHSLLGTWSTTWYGVSIPFPHLIYFSDVDGTIADGEKLISLPGRTVLASRTSGGVYIAVIDATTSYYDYYYFTLGGEELEGLACTALKASSAPSLENCRGLLFGNRAFSPLESRTNWDSPVAAKALPDPSDAARAAEAGSTADSTAIARVRSALLETSPEASLVAESIRSAANR